ncbi:cytochrome c oxidase assembly protein [Amycolatopsis sp. K13G38]|uniref:Cytochrome c oxidase assembly protein n=1 Tax=Amycolatopsis acididurans TaxID=2724524 RepID=A0ABX1IYJ0_9PSEU|nr:cytochrome c oxidase assembly protein [Amycolatopsis acididurans]NKQ52519.1 cytochrome c oxidase assembly protein [Amycolatopsis acididurans]
MTTPLSWHALFAAWDMPVAAAVLVVLAAGLYLWGARRARPWPLGRTAWFLGGLVVVVVAVGSSVNAYSGVLFSMHMAQHLLLIAVAPTLLVLGRPLALLHAALGERPVLDRVVRLVTHPLPALGVYAAVVAGTHLTPFLQGALTHPALHGLEEVAYLVAGYLVLLPVLGDSPVRPPLPPVLGLVVLFLGMVIDTVVGVSLLMTPHEPFPAYAAVARDWGPGLIEDLHWGGAAMWVGGDILMAALAIIVIGRWVSAPDHGNDLGPWLEAARRSALGSEDSTADVDDDEDALRAYNAMLARLASGRRPGGREPRS